MLVDSKKEAKTQKIDTNALILERLEKLEQENKSLKEQINSVGGQNKSKIKNEEYKGPRQYRYKMFGTEPIISIRSYAKDETKPLSYQQILQNGRSVMIDNHYVEIETLDGKKFELLNLDYSRRYTLSSFQFPKAIKTIEKDGKTETIMTFEKDGKEFNISSNFIN